MRSSLPMILLLTLAAPSRGEDETTQSSFVHRCEQAMKSAPRIAAEDKLRSAHEQSFQDARKWLLVRPWWLVYFAASRGNLPLGVVKKFKESSTYKDFIESNARLEQIEAEENFFSSRAYKQELRHLLRGMTFTLPTEAYYPFAGTDIYWSTIFRKVKMADNSYDQPMTVNMYWEPEAYRASIIESRIEKFKVAELIPADHTVEFIDEDVYQSSVAKDFNEPGHALVISGNHSVVPYLKSVYGQGNLNFGALIFGSPADSPGSVEAHVAKSGYVLTAVLSLEHMEVPYALKPEIIYVYTKP